MPSYEDAYRELLKRPMHGQRREVPNSVGEVPGLNEPRDSDRVKTEREFSALLAIADRAGVDASRALRRR